MSVDERILRLENALATLAELSARHDERVRELGRMHREHANTTQQLAGTAERLAGTTQELARASQTLTHLAERASERADTQDGWVNEPGREQAEVDRKLGHWLTRRCRRSGRSAV